MSLQFWNTVTWISDTCKCIPTKIRFQEWITHAIFQLFYFFFFINFWFFTLCYNNTFLSRWIFFLFLRIQFVHVLTFSISIDFALFFQGLAELHWNHCAITNLRFFWHCYQKSKFNSVEIINYFISIHGYFIYALWSIMCSSYLIATIFLG